MKTEEKEDIKIEKMILNIDGEKISLTIEQSKKLKKILDELFGKEIIKEVEHHYHNGWYYRPWAISTINSPTLYVQNTTTENQIFTTVPCTSIMDSTLNVTV